MCDLYIKFPFQSLLLHHPCTICTQHLLQPLPLKAEVISPANFPLPQKKLFFQGLILLCAFKSVIIQPRRHGTELGIKQETQTEQPKYLITNSNMHSAWQAKGNEILETTPGSSKRESTAQARQKGVGCGAQHRDRSGFLPLGLKVVLPDWPEV